MTIMAMQKPASLSRLSEKKKLSMPAPLALHKPRSTSRLGEKNSLNTPAKGSVFRDPSRRFSTGFLPLSDEKVESTPNEAPIVATLDLLIAPVNMGRSDLQRWLHRGSAGFVSVTEEDDDTNLAQQLFEAMEKCQLQTMDEVERNARGSSSPPGRQAHIKFYRDLSPVTAPYTFYNATSSSPPPSAWNSLPSTPVRTPRNSLRKPLQKRLKPDLPPSPPPSHTPSSASAPVHGTLREEDKSTPNLSAAERDCTAIRKAAPAAKPSSIPQFTKALQRSNTYSGLVTTVPERRTLITSPQYKERIVSGRRSAISDGTLDGSNGGPLEVMADSTSSGNQQQQRHCPPGESHFTEHLRSRGSSLGDIDESGSYKESVLTETFLGITSRLSFVNEEDERTRAQGWVSIVIERTVEEADKICPRIH